MGSEKARQEAELRWPLEWASTADEVWGRDPLGTPERDAFVAGAERQAAQPVTVTDEQVALGAAAMAVYWADDTINRDHGEALRLALAALDIEVTP